MKKVNLSVVILTKNEENNIESCLSSVHDWADEIIVVDDESTDQTLTIAENYADQILKRKMENEGSHRNWAYQKAKHEWVLSLDADEMVTEELQREIEDNLKDNDCAAFAIPLRTYIGDYWVKYGGWYPASKIRLFKKTKFRYEEVEVHPRAFVDGKAGSLTKDIIHKGYPDFEHFLASLNRQTTLEAQKWIRTGQRITTGRIVRRSVDRFFRTLIRKRSFKDGFMGFMIAYFASLYQVMSFAKYWEMKRKLSAHSLQKPDEKLNTEGLRSESSNGV